MPKKIQHYWDNSNWDCVGTLPKIEQTRSNKIDIRDRDLTTKETKR